jgi:hypothetical protein
MGIGGTVVTVGTDELFAGVAVMIAWKFCTVTDATQPALDVFPLLQEERPTAKHTTAIARKTVILLLKLVQRPQTRNNRLSMSVTSP